MSIVSENNNFLNANQNLNKTNVYLNDCRFVYQNIQNIPQNVSQNCTQSRSDLKISDAMIGKT